MQGCGHGEGRARDSPNGHDGIAAGLLDFVANLFPGPGHEVADVARRLGLDEAVLRAVRPSYRRFEIPKRGGSKRRILAPDPETKRLQRRIRSPLTRARRRYRIEGALGCSNAEHRVMIRHPGQNGPVEIAAYWSQPMQGCGHGEEGRARDSTNGHNGIAVGLLDFVAKFFPGPGHDVADVARRLGLDEEELRGIEPSYRRFEIPKRGGGKRRILAPDPETKRLQRRILRRLLARLEAHPAAIGFERGGSIVANARPHVGQAVVVRMDVKDFFPATRAGKVKKWFRRIGYNREASRLLTRLTTYDGGLPAGAPTSPRLSTLVNRKLDARLAGLAKWGSAAYTRYADDLTFSFAEDDVKRVLTVVSLARKIAAEEGYELHRRRKLRIRRRHQRQIVTGLVVNERLQLPRETRRWLRAVEHRARLRETDASAPAPTLTAEQLAGWRALRSMVENG